MDMRLQSDWVFIDRILEQRRHEIYDRVAEEHLARQIGRTSWFNQLMTWKRSRKIRVGKTTQPIHPVISRGSYH